jgi:hypothetical protein
MLSLRVSRLAKVTFETKTKVKLNLHAEQKHNRDSLGRQVKGGGGPVAIHTTLLQIKQFLSTHFKGIVSQDWGRL